MIMFACQNPASGGGGVRWSTPLSPESRQVGLPRRKTGFCPMLPHSLSLRWLQQFTPNLQQASNQKWLNDSINYTAFRRRELAGLAERSGKCPWKGVIQRKLHFILVVGKKRLRRFLLLLFPYLLHLIWRRKWQASCFLFYAFHFYCDLFANIMLFSAPSFHLCAVFLLFSICNSNTWSLLFFNLPPSNIRFLEDCFCPSFLFLQVFVRLFPSLVGFPSAWMGLMVCRFVSPSYVGVYASRAFFFVRLLLSSHFGITFCRTIEKRCENKYIQAVLPPAGSCFLFVCVEILFHFPLVFFCLAEWFRERWKHPTQSFWGNMHH